jgi:hypothetical protein
VKKIGNLKNPGAKKRLGRNFSQDALTKSSGNFGIVRAAQEDSKGLKFSFLPPKNLCTLKKSRCLKILGIWGIFMFAQQFRASDKG